MLGRRTRTENVRPIKDDEEEEETARRYHCKMLVNKEKKKVFSETCGQSRFLILSSDGAALERNLMRILSGATLAG